MLEDILQSTSAVVYVKDLNFNYLYINKSFEDLMEQTADELLGKDDYHFYPDAIADDLRRVDRLVLTENKIMQFEERVPFRGEMRIWISIKFPVKNADGEVYGIAGTSVDISDLYQTNQNLSLELKERLKQQELLFEIGQLLLDNDQSEEYVLQEIVNRIPHAWVDPDNTKVKIEIGSHVALSEDYRDSSVKLVEWIKPHYGEGGSIQVCYTGKINDDSRIIFLNEERRLLQTISSQIKTWLEKRYSENILKRTLNDLEVLIQKRTNEVVMQKQIIEEKHKEITDSINYAEYLQKALMANDRLLENHLKEYFTFFNPKEAVSGDFYWGYELEDGRLAFIVADSTGHGVPGAIMSLMNMNSLKESIKEGLRNPDEMLNYSRQSIIETLSNDKRENAGRDGMDAALLIYDKRDLTMDVSMANNPIIVVRDNQVIEFKADRMPVGKHDRQEIPFSKQQIQLFSGDTVYLFTDGFADQFGGIRQKKFLYKRLRELFHQIHHLPAANQLEELRTAFNDWKGSLEQVDDVCIFGFKV